MKKALLLSTLSFLVGATTSFLYFKKEYEKAVADMNEQIAKIEADNAEMHVRAAAVAEENQSAKAKLADIYTSYAPTEQEPISYNIFSSHPKDDIEDKQEAVKDMDAVAMEIVEEMRKGKPKLIRMSDYGTDPRYRSEVLYYYQEDGILTDEEGEVIENPDDITGDCMDRYGFRDDDEQFLYIRNDILKVEYEISKQTGISYRDSYGQ